MREEDSEGLKAFEAALASLVPRADRLDRDRLMFLAGQQSRTGFQPVENAGAMPTLAVGMSETSGKSQHAHGRRGHGTPASRWAWPAAFTAMTALAAVLAVLLAIRPAIPVGGLNPPSIAANSNENQSPAAAHRQLPNIPIDPNNLENDSTGQHQPTSPLIAFLQTFWNSTNAGHPAEPSPPASNSLSYPQLRDRILRQGLESWQLAQAMPGTSPAHDRELSTRRELLKDFLPDTQQYHSLSHGLEHKEPL